MTELYNESSDIQEAGEVMGEETKTIDTIKLERLIQSKRDNQNFFAAVVGGLVASLIGAAAWAGITVASEYQIGWMAVGVGFLVGFSIRLLGKGFDTKYGILGAVLSLFGCLFGNFLTIIIIVAMQENISFFQLLASIDIGAVIGLMGETFEAMDLLFYGIAVYEGYRFSINKLSEEDLQAVQRG